MALSEAELCGPGWQAGGAARHDGPPHKSAPARSKKSIVSIRLPEDRDWGSIKELVRRQHARTIFADIPFSETKYDAIEKEARVPKPHRCLIVAEMRGRIVGMAWFSAGEYVLGEGGLMTTTHLIAVDTERPYGYLAAKTFMRLVQGVRLWSEGRGAKYVLVHVTTGSSVQSTHRLLGASGARCIGGAYILSSNTSGVRN